MFKQKNKKIIQCDSRITLDAKHNEIIKNFKEEQKNIKKYYLELKSEEEKLDKAFHNAQSEFASKNNMKLMENTMQKKVNELNKD